MAAINLHQIIHSGESRTIEYKSGYSPSLLKSVCAFANWHDGLIILGVDDRGQLVGVDQPNSLRLRIENAINDNIDPRPLYRMSTQTADGRTLLLVSVYRGEHTPYYYQGRAYVRSDTATVPADRLKLSQLVLAGQNLTYEDLPSSSQKLSFSRFKALFQERVGVRTFNQDLLKTLGLIRDGRYSQAAALLSDSNPVASSSLALLLFDGDSMNLADRQVVEHVPIFDQLSAGMAFCQKHLRTAERIDGMLRQTIEEVPAVACREALANALLHRDYLTAGQIKVEISSRAICVISPGSLPPGLTPGEFQDGCISVFRNPVLADVFFRLGLAEKLATGIRRIRQAYAGRTDQPEFLASENYTRITLPRDTSHSGDTSPLVLQDETPSYGLQPVAKPADLASSPVALPYREHATHLFGWMRLHRTISRAEAERMLGLGKTQASKVLRTWEYAGWLYRTGEGRNTRYHLIERRD